MLTFFFWKSLFNTVSNNRFQYFFWNDKNYVFDEFHRIFTLNIRLITGFNWGNYPIVKQAFQPRRLYVTIFFDNRYWNIEELCHTICWKLITIWPCIVIFLRVQFFIPTLYLQQNVILKIMQNHLNKITKNKQNSKAIDLQ